MKDQERKSKRRFVLILSVLGIMFLVISQVIALLINSNPVLQMHDSTQVENRDVTLQDIEAVNSDLNQVRKSLDEINKKPFQHENKAVRKGPETPPVVNEAVNKDIEKVEQKTVNTDVDLAGRNTHPVSKAEIINPVSKPVPVPVAPKVVLPEVAIKQQQGRQQQKSQRRVEKAGDINNSAQNEKGPASFVQTSVKIGHVAGQSAVKPVAVEQTTAEKQAAYIKYDSNGNLIEADEKQWSCVFDTKSGLMWEVKSREDSLRYPENLYSWYSPEYNTLQGVTDGGRCKGGIACDTHSYVEAMNRKKFCGHNDWRLPTDKEMLGLVSYESGPNNIKIDTSFFPNTLPSWYWTASSNESHPEYAWYVLFKNGLPLNGLKENPKHIRLVRNESSS